MLPPSESDARSTEADYDRPHIFLVRHGQTDLNKERRMQGRIDEPLNRKGKRQSERIAETLAGVDFDSIYTSPLQRARATADAIVAHHPGIELHELEEMRELDMGEYEGHGEDELEAEYGEQWTEFRSHAYLLRPPGGENLADALERLGDWPDKWKREAERTPLALVGHQGVNLALKSVWLGIGLDEPTEQKRLRLLELKQPNDRIDVIDPVAGELLEPISVREE